MRRWVGHGAGCAIGLAVAAVLVTTGCQGAGTATPVDQPEAIDRLLATAVPGVPPAEREQRYETAAASITAEGVVLAARRDPAALAPAECFVLARLFWERESAVACARMLAAGTQPAADPAGAVWGWVGAYGDEPRHRTRVRALTRGFTVLYRELDAAGRAHVARIFRLPKSPRPLHPEDFARIVLAD